VCVCVFDVVLVHQDKPAPVESRLLALLDSIIIVAVSVAVVRTFLSFCERGSIPPPWVILWSGDEFQGEVIEVTKKHQLLFTEVEEIHSLPHGYGVYRFASGAEYDGGWQEGRMCGVHGKLTFAEGHVYDGEWEAGLFSGHGTFTWASGAVFMGEFKDGLPNGQVFLCLSVFSADLFLSLLHFVPCIASQPVHLCLELRYSLGPRRTVSSAAVFVLTMLPVVVRDPAAPRGEGRRVGRVAGWRPQGTPGLTICCRGPS